MTPEQFTYWLQGYMEIADPKKLNEKQVQEIKNHLKLVFKKETPELSNPFIHVDPTIHPYERTSPFWEIDLNPPPYIFDGDSLPPGTTITCSIDNSTNLADYKYTIWHSLKDF